MENFNCRVNAKIPKENIIQLLKNIDLKYDINKVLSAIKKSNYNFSIWKGESLVGVLTAISDESINVFLTFILIDSNFSNHDLESLMIKEFCKTFESFERKIVFFDKKYEKIFKKMGFYQVI